MTPQLHLIFMALKRKPVARGMRAPRLPSIVGGFFPLPSQEYGADRVAGDSSSISGAGKLLLPFGWILHQTHSQLLPQRPAGIGERSGVDFPTVV